MILYSVRSTSTSYCGQYITPVHLLFTKGKSFTLPGQGLELKCANSSLSPLVRVPAYNNFLIHLDIVYYIKITKIWVNYSHMAVLREVESLSAKWQSAILTDILKDHIGASSWTWTKGLSVNSRLLPPAELMMHNYVIFSLISLI